MQVHNLPFCLEVPGSRTIIQVPVQQAEAYSVSVGFDQITLLYVEAMRLSTIVEVNACYKMLPVYLVEPGQRKQVIWLACLDDRWVLHLNGGEVPPIGNKLGICLEGFVSRGMAGAHRRLWTNILLQLKGMGEYPEAFWGSPWLAALEVQKRIFLNFLRGEQRVVRANPCALTKYACALRLTLKTLGLMVQHASRPQLPRMRLR